MLGWMGKASALSVAVIMPYHTASTDYKLIMEDTNSFSYLDWAAKLNEIPLSKAKNDICPKFHVPKGSCFYPWAYAGLQ